MLLPQAARLTCAWRREVPKRMGSGFRSGLGDSIDEHRPTTPHHPDAATPRWAARAPAPTVLGMPCSTRPPCLCCMWPLGVHALQPGHQRLRTARVRLQEHAADCAGQEPAGAGVFASSSGGHASCPGGQRDALQRPAPAGCPGSHHRAAGGPLTLLLPVRPRHVCLQRTRPAFPAMRARRRCRSSSAWGRVDAGGCAGARPRAPGQGARGVRCALRPAPGGPAAAGGADAGHPEQHAPAAAAGPRPVRLDGAGHAVPGWALRHGLLRSGALDGGWQPGLSASLAASAQPRRPHAQQQCCTPVGGLVSRLASAVCGPQLGDSVSIAVPKTGRSRLWAQTLVGAPDLALHSGVRIQAGSVDMSTCARCSLDAIGVCVRPPPCF